MELIIIFVIIFVIIFISSIIIQNIREFFNENNVLFDNFIYIFLIIFISLYFIYKFRTDIIIKSSIIIGYECNRDDGVIEDVTTRFNLKEKKEDLFQLKEYMKSYLIILFFIFIILYLIIIIIMFIKNKFYTFNYIFIIIFLIVFMSVVYNEFSSDTYDKYIELLNCNSGEVDTNNQNQEENILNFYKNENIVKNNNGLILDFRKKDENINHICDDTDNYNDYFNILNTTKIDLKNKKTTKILDDFKKYCYGDKIFGDFRLFDVLWIFIFLMVYFLIESLFDVNKLYPLYLILILIIIIIFLYLT
jgi:hypothetical protein